MLNLIWILFFVASAVAACWQIVVQGDLSVFERMMTATFAMGRTGFEISLGLTGVLAFWLGMMRVGEQGGMVRLLARMAAPILRRLFPSVPDGHPAMGSVVMNLAANMLGLDNAATPLGLKAMRELQELNPAEDTASDDQIMFLVINTSAVTIVPVTIFTYLYQLGYARPTELFVPILIATFCSTLAGISITACVQRRPLLRSGIAWILLAAAGVLGVVIFISLQMPREQLQTVSMVAGNALLFTIIMAFIGVAALRRVNVYEAFVAGARDGFSVAIGIIPYLIAMLVAIGVLRASGALDLLLLGFERMVSAVCVVLSGIGLMEYTGGRPQFIDALPTALMKPLSGSGARGMMIETIRTHGVDTLVARMVAVIQGSTETTFYVLAVYCGAVGLRRVRHAPLCGLVADGAGVAAGIAVCYLFFG